MNRIEAVFGLGGLAIFVFLLVGGLLRRSQKRFTRTTGVDFDAMGLDGTSGDTQEAGEDRPGIYPDFRALLEQVVLPRRQAQPGWGRLDGAEGIPGRKIALFDRGGTVYAVNGECRLDALMAAWNWMEDHPGQDPLVVQPTKSRRGRLMLRPELARDHPKGLLIETE